MTAIVRVVGGHSSAYTGAAVVHRELARQLPAQLGDLATVDDVHLGPKLSNRLRGDRSPNSAAVAIFTSTPLPLATNASASFSIVYDLRWRWTRGKADRTYRYLDLKRTTARASGVFVSSLAVIEQLRALRQVPTGRRQLHLLSFGPGQFEGFNAPPPRAGTPRVMLVGAAPHKRNELAARLLVGGPGPGCGLEIVAVSVSPTTKQILRDGLPANQISLLDGLSPQELHDAYASATTYLSLGMSEGFGFPYIEAAYAGCDVLAIRQPLTIELFGDDAILLPTPNPTAEQVWDQLAEPDMDRITRLQQRATDRSWAKTAGQVALAIRPFLAS